MKCRYCHRSSLLGNEVCLRCEVLIGNAEWEQLARLQLFFHPDEWISDVAAFIELTEVPGAGPQRLTPATHSTALSGETLALVRSALADAIDDLRFADYCRDCADVPCDDHRAAVERRRRYQELYQQLGRMELPLSA